MPKVKVTPPAVQVVSTSKNGRRISPGPNPQSSKRTIARLRSRTNVQRCDLSVEPIAARKELEMPLGTSPAAPAGSPNQTGYATAARLVQELGAPISEPRPEYSMIKMVREEFETFLKEILSRGPPRRLSYSASTDNLQFHPSLPSSCQILLDDFLQWNELMSELNRTIHPDNPDNPNPFIEERDMYHEIQNKELVTIDAGLYMTLQTASNGQPVTLLRFAVQIGLQESETDLRDRAEKLLTGKSPCLSVLLVLLDTGNKCVHFEALETK